MRKIFFIGFFLCSLALASSAQEQDRYSDSDTVVTDLDEIVVSANRWEQNLREVANKVSTVNASLVQFQNPQTAADLLSFSNSVFVQKSQLGGGSPMIRGFATNRVLLVVDGVRMNNAIFRSGNVQNVISLDPNTIAEAEVIFGPGSVMYGSDAIGGVMDFHTIATKLSDDKAFDFSANAMTRYSSANKERTLHIDANVFGKKWSFLTSVSRSIFDDLTMGSDGPVEYTRPDFVIRENGADVVVINPDPDVQVNSAYDQWNFMQKLSFKPTSNLRFEYAWHNSKTSDFPRYDRLILREDGELANAEWYYGPQKWDMHSLSAKYNRPNAIFDEMKVILAIQNYEESRHNRGFGGARTTHRTETVEALSVNLDLDKRIVDQLTLFYGAEWIGNVVGSTANRVDATSGVVDGTSTRYPDGSRWNSAAAYLNLKFKPTEAWIINASARFTSVQTNAAYDLTYFDFPFTEASLRNENVNGSLGVIYSPTAKLKVYANGSTGFRAPNVDDIGKVFDSSPGSVVVPNPSLEAEKALSIETGFAAIVIEGLKLDASLYHSTISNAIARGESTFNGEAYIDYDGELSRVYSQQNISEVRVSGLQFGLDWKFLDRFNLTSSLNYQKGKELDPQTDRDYSPTHVAPLFGSTHLIAKVGKVTVDLYANYNGAIQYENLALTERADAHLYATDDDGNPHAPAWTTFNLKAQWQAIKDFSLSAGIENIFDRRYRPYSSGITAPGRNFILSLRATI